MGEGQVPIGESPRPMIKGMDFFDALREVAKGKKITRLSWDRKDCYGSLENGFLMYHNEKGWHNWIVSNGDMEGLDWVVCEELTTNITN